MMLAVVLIVAAILLYNVGKKVQKGVRKAKRVVNKGYKLYGNLCMFGGIVSFIVDFIK